MMQNRTEQNRTEQNRTEKILFTIDNVMYKLIFKNWSNDYDSTNEDIFICVLAHMQNKRGTICIAFLL